MKSFVLLLLFLLVSCSSHRRSEQTSGLNIIEINPNKWTAITKQNLLHLTQIYDLTPFFFTKKIHIQSRVTPHSHPVLTLNTRQAENPKKILSTFLHEELHWWLTLNANKTNAAISDLKKIFRKVPVTKKSQIRSVYLHLIVNYLEIRALEHYLGKKETREIIHSLIHEDRIYPWTYSNVLRNPKTLNRIIKKHQLLPLPLN